ncbi:DUF1062 domain-containing protein [Micromonospora fulviviridis]|uniref:DUF1062 domain-containing protein n=1 Tax=Micromonospora fulviviridis TaxID=47860 RepID=A0ABV2VV14_9ACTN
MSTRPHILLSRTLRRTRLPLLAFRVHYHSGRGNPVDGKFRVSASGALPDIWLLVACVPCDHTSKITDRVPVRYVEPILLRGYSGNSSSLVARALLDPLIARRNRFALEWDSCWEVFAPSPPECPWPVQLSVIFDDPVPLRPERLIPEGAGHQPRGDRSPRQDRYLAEPRNSQGLLLRPATSRRCGPELGREARWPRPGLHHAAVRARSLMTGRDLTSGLARYRRRR